jgi:CHRD domain
MQRHRRIALVAGLSLIVAAMVGTVATALPAVMNLTTHMSTAEEVPVPNFDAIARNPQGTTVLRVDRNGELTYRLNVANIENVTMAHIHIGPPGAAGPIAVWLYPSEPPLAPTPIPGFSNGPLASGTITDEDVNFPGNPTLDPVTTVEALLAHVRAGNAYVNVHTVQNGPGEIRGQIEARGPGAHQH